MICLEKVRSFLSLNIDASLVDSLAIIQSRVKEALADYSIKWEKPDKFHMTMRFLGDMYRNSINELIKQLEFINFEFKSIEMYTSGIGFFPNRKFPNVVFVDLIEKENNTEKLVSNIDNVLNLFGIKPDKKFVPHITLGRFRRENKKRLYEDFNVEVDKIPVIFDSYYLMKSELTPKGSVYSVIKKFNFQ